MCGSCRGNDKSVSELLQSVPSTFSCQREFTDIDQRTRIAQSSKPADCQVKHTDKIPRRKSHHIIATVIDRRVLPADDNVITTSLPTPARSEGLSSSAVWLSHTSPTTGNGLEAWTDLVLTDGRSIGDGQETAVSMLEVVWCQVQWYAYSVRMRR